jgi:hypothetical protein
VNFWSGTDFNIIDNNSLNVCDENVFQLHAPDINLGSNGLLSNDYNGAYVDTNALEGGTGCAYGAGSFDINAQIPFNVNRGIAYVYAHTMDFNIINTTSFSTALTIFITPYLQILGFGPGLGIGRGPNRLDRPYSPQDRNFMVRGVGFPIDSNVTFSIISLSDYANPIDVNITDDGNGTVFTTAACDANTGCDTNTLPNGVVKDFQSTSTTAFGDGNYVLVDSNFIAVFNTGNGLNAMQIDNNSWGYWRNGPDGIGRTGGFDINILMPQGASFLNVSTIDFNINTTPADANRFTGVNQEPKKLDGTDANITVTPDLISSFDSYDMKTLVSSTWVDYNSALVEGNISNFQAVNFWIRPISGGAYDMNIVTNTDVNLLAGNEIRNYDGNFISGTGRAGIDTGQLAEFKVDANITMYNVPSTGTIPRIMRDGYRCDGAATSICRNVDNTALDSGFSDVYSTKTWAYNSTDNDGNLFFRASTFSIFTTTSTVITVTDPNGGENIAQTSEADGNYTISFTYSDSNESETLLNARLYYTDTNGTAESLIVEDLNLLNSELISCTDSDSNIATTNTCTYDWNVGGIAPGEYWIDVNVMEFSQQNDLNAWTYDSSDKNFLVNAPYIRLVDPIFTTEKYTLGVTTKDANITVALDFNIFYPNDMNVLADLNNLSIWFDKDTNALNGVDGNFVDGNAGADRNFTDGNGVNRGIFYSSGDLNIADFNTAIGFGDDLNTQLDHSFSFDINMLSTAASGIRGAWYIRVDANYGSAYSPYKVFFNDKRPVGEITLPGTNAPSTTRYMRGTSARIDFNASDADDFDYNKLDGNFLVADFYLDSDNNFVNGFGSRLINDLNLAAGSGTSRTCFQDLNGSGAGTTGNADQNSAVDANCTTTFDSTAFTDGNYFLVIDLNEGLNTGPGTGATDYNYSDFNIVIDNTVPTISTSNLTTSDSTPTIDYTYSDVYGVNATYVRIANGAWTFNAKNNSYTFGTLAVGIHFFDVNVVDNAGNEATASGSITVSGGSSSSGGSGGSGGGGGSGGSGGSSGQQGGQNLGTPTSGQADSATIDSILSDGGYPIGTSEIVSSAGSKFGIETFVKSSGSSTTVTSKILNSSNSHMSNVRVVVNVPKSFAETATKVSSSLPFSVRKDDPIIEFTIDSLAPGDSFNIDYTIGKKILSSVASKSIFNPLIVAFTETEVSANCVGINCNDNNPCTSDVCSNAECSNIPLADGVTCGNNKECRAGQCVVKSTSTTTPTGGATQFPSQPAAADSSGLLVVGILIILVILGVFLWKKKQKGYGWPS